MARLTKKELRKDPIRDFLVGIFNYVTEKRERLYWSGGLIALILLLSLYRGFNRPKSNPDAEIGLIQGIMLLANNDTTNASKILTNLVTTYPNTPEGKKAFYYYATLKLIQGDTSAAEEYLRKFLKSGSDDSYLVAFANAKLADLLMDRGQFDKAASLFAKSEEMVSINALKRYFFLKRIRALRLAQKYDEALSLLKEFKSKNSLGSYGSEFQEEEALLEGFLLKSKNHNMGRG